MASSGSSKPFSLADLGRSSFVSQRGLADTLKRLQDAGKLVDMDATSRASIKRARERELESMTTRYGPIYAEKILLSENKKKSYACHILNPVSLWCYLVETQHGLSHLLESTLTQRPATRAEPWRLILYCDELILGNALRHQNNRKLQVFYFSWKELGLKALSNEKVWWPLAVIRSQKVAELGGVSVVWPQILDPWLVNLLCFIVSLFHVSFFLHTSSFAQT